MKPSCLKIALACLGLLSPLGAERALAEPAPALLVVEVTEADDLAARRLLALTEQPAQLVRLAEASEPARALALARAAGARQVVIFDSEQQQVVVLRTSDGAAWLRRTDAAGATPFVAAFVAVELLGLSVQASASAPRQAPVRTAWLGLRVGLDALATGPAAGSLRPSLGLLLGFGRTDSLWHWLLELHAAPHGQHEQRLAAGRLQLTRSDLTARVGALWQRQRWGVLGFTEAGVLRVDASYRGNTARDERRSALLVGLGAEPNLQLTSWLRLFVSASLQAATPRGDYRVAGLSALREPALGLQLGAGMWLTLPIH